MTIDPKVVEEARRYRILDARRVESFEELATAIQNGYRVFYPKGSEGGMLVDDHFQSGEFLCLKHGIAREKDWPHPALKGEG